MFFQNLYFKDAVHKKGDQILAGSGWPTKPDKDRKIRSYSYAKGGCCLASQGYMSGSVPLSLPLCVAPSVIPAKIISPSLCKAPFVYTGPV